MSTMLLQEDFPGVTWARRNCDDTGFLDIVENDGALDVTGGNLVVSNQTTAAWGDLGVCFGGSFTRAAGLAFLAYATISGGADVKWGSSQNPATATLLPGNANPDETNSFYFDDGNLKYNDSNIGGPSMGSVPTGSYYIAQIHRTAGDFMLIKGEAYTEWTLLWIGNAWTNDPIYHAAWTLEASTWHTMRAVNLPAPWDTDYGIATDRLAGAITVGTTFTHEADFVMEFTVTARTTIGTNMAVRFRVQDANNFWFIRITSGGVTNLVEYVSGSTDRASSGAGSVATGHRVVIRADDETITAWSNNVQLWSYSSAANFKTETDGEVDEDGDGTLSDLVVYPRTLSGAALSQMNKAFA